MKKGLTFLLVIFSIILLSTSFIIAQENQDNENIIEDTDSELAKEEIEKLKNPFGEGLKEMFGEGLKKEFIVPEYLQIPARIIFGVEETISIQGLVILITIWFMLFFIIADILKITPFVKGSLVWIMSFFVTSLVALSGAVKSLAVFFFNLGTTFKFFEDWPALAIIITLAVIFVLGYILHYVMKIFKEYAELEGAEQRGLSIGKMVAMARGTEEAEGL